MTLVLLLVGLFVFWFTFHAVADHIEDLRIKKFIDARDGEPAYDHVDEDLRRNKR